jgi:hypothetical protein
VHEERAVGGPDDPDPVETTDGGDNRLPVLLVARVDGDVAHDHVLHQLDEVDGPDVPAGLPDGRGESAEHSGPVLDRGPER